MQDNRVRHLAQASFAALGKEVQLMSGSSYAETCAKPFRRSLIKWVLTAFPLSAHVQLRFLIVKR